MTTPLIRPYKIDDKYHKDLWKEKNVTVLICQRKTKSLIQLCLESLLQFYPDIPIVVMDGQSDDDSLLYLKWMAITNSNISVQSTDTRSHGLAMDEAITKYINTKYVLLMDSDTIVHRGGWIDRILSLFQDNPRLFACGTLMEVSRENQGCGDPHNENDILKYAHPSCSICDVEKYKQLPSFTDHGAPCWATMAMAAEKGWDVIGYPIEHYVMHNCGSTWQEVPTVWENDFGVYVRPFVTFITHGNYNNLFNQTDRDFSVVVAGDKTSRKLSTYRNMNMTVENHLYESRFMVNSEYVVYLNGNISTDFVRRLKEMAIELNAPDEFELFGVRVVRRNYWQQKDTLSL